MSTSQITGTVASVEDVSVTRAGNVTRRIHLQEHGAYVTAPNSASGYYANNLREGQRVTLTISDATRRVHIIEEA